MLTPPVELLNSPIKDSSGHIVTKLAFISPNFNPITLLPAATKLYEKHTILHSYTGPSWERQPRHCIASDVAYMMVHRMDETGGFDAELLRVNRKRLVMLIWEYFCREQVWCSRDIAHAPEFCVICEIVEEERRAAEGPTGDEEEKLRKWVRRI